MKVFKVHWVTINRLQISQNKLIRKIKYWQLLVLRLRLLVDTSMITTWNSYVTSFWSYRIHKLTCPRLMPTDTHRHPHKNHTECLSYTSPAKSETGTWQPTVFLCSLLLVSRLLSGLMLRRVRPPVPWTWPVGLVAFSSSRNSSTSRSN